MFLNEVEELPLREYLILLMDMGVAIKDVSDLKEAESIPAIVKICHNRLLGGARLGVYSFACDYRGCDKTINPSYSVKDCLATIDTVAEFYHVFLPFQRRLNASGKSLIDNVLEWVRFDPISFLEIPEFAQSDAMKRLHQIARYLVSAESIDEQYLEQLKMRFKTANPLNFVFNNFFHFALYLKEGYKIIEDYYGLENNFFISESSEALSCFVPMGESNHILSANVRTTSENWYETYKYERDRMGVPFSLVLQFFLDNGLADIDEHFKEKFIKAILDNPQHYVDSENECIARIAQKEVGKKFFDNHGKILG